MSDVIQDLDQQIATLQRQKQELLDKQKLEKLREVKVIIAQFGFTSTDLGLQSSKRSLLNYLRNILTLTTQTNLGTVVEGPSLNG